MILPYPLQTKHPNIDFLRTEQTSEWALSHNALEWVSGFTHMTWSHLCYEDVVMDWSDVSELQEKRNTVKPYIIANQVGRQRVKLHYNLVTS